MPRKPAWLILAVMLCLPFGCHSIAAEPEVTLLKKAQEQRWKELESGDPRTETYTALLKALGEAYAAARKDEAVAAELMNLYAWWLRVYCCDKENRRKARFVLQNIEGIALLLRPDTSMRIVRNIVEDEELHSAGRLRALERMSGALWQKCVPLSRRAAAYAVGLHAKDERFRRNVLYWHVVRDPVLLRELRAEHGDVMVEIALSIPVYMSPLDAHGPLLEAGVLTKKQHVAWLKEQLRKRARHDIVDFHLLREKPMYKKRLVELGGASPAELAEMDRAIAAHRESFRQSRLEVVRDEQENKEWRLSVLQDLKELKLISEEEHAGLLKELKLVEAEDEAPAEEQ